MNQWVFLAAGARSGGYGCVCACVCVRESVGGGRGAGRAELEHALDACAGRISLCAFVICWLNVWQ